MAKKTKMKLDIMSITVLLYVGLATLIGFSAPVWAIAAIYIASRSVSMTI